MLNGEVYWREQCKSCTNREQCDCRKSTEDFINKLRSVEKSHIGAYGNLRFTCDYFNLDKTTLENEHNCKAL